MSRAFHLYELARQLRAHATVAFVVLLLGTRFHGIEPSFDLFITRSDTYVLNPQGGSVETCEKLGDTGWHPLPQDWLCGTLRPSAFAILTSMTTRIS